MCGAENCRAPPFAGVATPFSPEFVEITAGDPQKEDPKKTEAPDYEDLTYSSPTYSKDEEGDAPKEPPTETNRKSLRNNSNRKRHQSAPSTQNPKPKRKPPQSNPIFQSANPRLRLPNRNHLRTRSPSLPRGRNRPRRPTSKPKAGKPNNRKIHLGGIRRFRGSQAHPGPPSDPACWNRGRRFSPAPRSSPTWPGKQADRPRKCRGWSMGFGSTWRTSATIMHRTTSGIGFWASPTSGPSASASGGKRAILEKTDLQVIRIPIRQGPPENLFLQMGGPMVGGQGRPVPSKEERYPYISRNAADCPCPSRTGSSTGFFERSASYAKEAAGFTGPAVERWGPFNSWIKRRARAETCKPGKELPFELDGIP